MPKLDDYQSWIINSFLAICTAKQTARPTLLRPLFSVWFQVEWAHQRGSEKVWKAKRWRSRPLEVRQVCTNEIFLAVVHWESWWEGRGSFNMALLSVLKLWRVSGLLHLCHLYLLSLSHDCWNCHFLDSTCSHALLVCMLTDLHIYTYYILSPIWMSITYHTILLWIHPRCVDVCQFIIWRCTHANINKSNCKPLWEIHKSHTWCQNISSHFNDYDVYRWAGSVFSSISFDSFFSKTVQAILSWN